MEPGSVFCCRIGGRGGPTPTSSHACCATNTCIRSSNITFTPSSLESPLLQLLLVPRPARDRLSPRVPAGVRAHLGRRSELHVGYAGERRARLGRPSGESHAARPNGAPLCRLAYGEETLAQLPPSLQVAQLRREQDVRPITSLSAAPCARAATAASSRRCRPIVGIGIALRLGEELQALVQRSGRGRAAAPLRGGWRTWRGRGRSRRGVRRGARPQRRCPLCKRELTCTRAHLVIGLGLGLGLELGYIRVGVGVRVRGRVSVQTEDHGGVGLPHLWLGL